MSGFSARRALSPPARVSSACLFVSALLYMRQVPIPWGLLAADSYDDVHSVDKISRAQKAVREVAELMTENTNLLLQREALLGTLSEKSGETGAAVSRHLFWRCLNHAVAGVASVPEILNRQALVYETGATTLRKTMCQRHAKLVAIVGGGALLRVTVQSALADCIRCARQIVIILLFGAGIAVLLVLKLALHKF